MRCAGRTWSAELDCQRYYGVREVSDCAGLEQSGDGVRADVAVEELATHLARIFQRTREY
jgi:hypothetical protein